jgi:hypothetical protein
LNPPWWWHSVSSLTKETVAAATRWGPIAFSTLAGNKYFLRDSVDTNHQLTTLQLFSLNLLPGLPDSLEYFMQTKFGNVAKGPSSRILDDNTVLENRSHNKLAEDALDGSAYRDWGIQLERSRLERID